MLDEHYDELMAMAPERLVPLNVDVARVVTLVYGASTEIAWYRPRMAECFGEHQARHCDRLLVLAQVLSHAAARHRALLCEGDLTPLIRLGLEARSLLRTLVDVLVARRVVKRSAIPALRGGNRARQVGFDLLDLVVFLSAQSAEARHVAGVTVGELVRGESLADALITGAAERAHGGRSESADLRQRAYSLLYESYDEVRAMLSYLRWKAGDADEIAPPFSGGRRRRPRARADAAAT